MSGLLLPVLAFHLLGMVMWIGGLLAALLALGMARRGDSVADRELQGAVARRALRGLAHPGAAVAIVAGVLLVFVDPRWMQQGWLHVKLVLVIVLIWLDLRMNARVRRLREREIDPAAVRRWHAGVWLLFLGILALAVLKPF